MQTTTLLRSVAVLGTVFLASSTADAQNVRITSNVSPYLHLTRTEFRSNGAFPVYQAIVQPELQRRAQLQQRTFIGRTPGPTSPFVAANPRPRRSVATFRPAPLLTGLLPRQSGACTATRFGTPAPRPTLSGTTIGADFATVRPTTGHTTTFGNIAAYFGTTLRR